MSDEFLDLGVVLPGEWHVTVDLVGFAGHVCDTHRRMGLSMYACNDGNNGPNGGCSHVRIDPCICQPQPPCDGCANRQHQRSAQAQPKL